MTDVKPALILLHGALGSASLLTEVASLLSRSFTVFSPDLPGHGERSGEEVSLTVDFLVDFLHAHIAQQGFSRPFVFGYSLGGYVALSHALKYPGEIGQILTLGTKFHWDQDEAQAQLKFLNVDIIREKVPLFAQLLKQRHGVAHWTSVLSRTAELMLHLGTHPVLLPETVQSIAIPVSIMLGAEDQMVTHAESQRIADSIPRGDLRILPGLPHAIEKIPVNVVVQLIRETARMQLRRD